MIKLMLVYDGPADERAKVNLDLVENCRQAFEIMLNKNTERNDCWKSTGILGAFVEIHSIYNRLREMIWNRTMNTKDPVWMKELMNCTMDMRNFTVLMELAAQANLPYGDDKYEKMLGCTKCGADGVDFLKKVLDK
jgi:hypothetical protein